MFKELLDIYASESTHYTEIVSFTLVIIIVAIIFFIKYLLTKRGTYEKA